MEDTMQHYAHCPHAADVAIRRLGLPRASTPAGRLERFLLVARFDIEEELIQQAQWTGTVYTWHNLCRHARELQTPAVRLEALQHCLRDTLSGCNTTSASGASS